MVSNKFGKIRCRIRKTTGSFSRFQYKTRISQDTILPYLFLERNLDWIKEYGECHGLLEISPYFRGHRSDPPGRATPRNRQEDQELPEWYSSKKAFSRTYKEVQR